MKSSLRLSTRQQIALTPQVQQTIRMLQLGAKELAEEIDERLQNNPLLQESKSFQSSSTNEDFSSWLENQPARQAQTLEDHLIGQLGYLNLDSPDYVIACIVISQLENDGYLRLEIDDLIQACADESIVANEQGVSRAIKIVQQLDPVGIAATDLTECLGLQIEQQQIDPTLKTAALGIISRLKLLASDRNELFQTLNIDKQTFEAALNLIQQLDPTPGKMFDREQTIYVQPDIFLLQSTGQLTLSLNPIINRGIELNQQYINLLKNSNHAADRDYLRKYLDRAKWWLNALQQRNKTLLSVAEYMITHQAEYFENSDLVKIRPLKQQQIANACGVHISTVSRAIRNKHLQTPTGIVALKRLLAGSIKINNKKSLSNTAVKSIIKNLIKNESSQSPLSDSKIVAELQIRGIIIARRTVNKYREQLNIPASNRRKVT